MPNPGRLYYYPGMLLDIIARCIAEPSLFVIGSLTTASIIVITTRIWTGRGFSSIEIWSEGQKSVPVVPYWLPFIGSLFAFIVDPDEFLRKSRYDKAKSLSYTIPNVKLQKSDDSRCFQSQSCKYFA